MGGVAGAAPVDQIAQRVRLTAAGKGHIGPQGGLQQITFAVDLHRLLGVLHHSPQARFGQHAAQTQPAAADPLDEAAHGAEFGPQRPCLDLGVGLRVGTHVGGDDPVDHASPDQPPDPRSGIAGVNGVDGQMPGAAVQHTLDQPLRHILPRLTADGNDLPVVELGDDLFPGAYFTQFHNILLCRTRVSVSGRAPDPPPPRPRRSNRHRYSCRCLRF